MPNNAKRRILLFVAAIVAAAPLSPLDHADAAWVRGVGEAEQHLYTPQAATWTCLDGSKTILSSSINDDYCDCPDGSDEPGTSACPNGSFYCRNIGHIAARIPSSSVDDGICDPDCCDGSDEATSLVTCPNTCKQVGEEYRRLQGEIRAVQAKGAAKRREMIAYGKKLKSERIATKKSIEEKLEGMRANVEELRKVKDALEARKATVRDEAKERIGYVAPTHSPTPGATCGKCPRCVQSSSVDCSEKVGVARTTLQTLLEHADELVAILRALKNDHNPNYNDMAVKHAVEAFDTFMKKWEVDVSEDDSIDGYREEVKQVIEDDLSDESFKDEKLAGADVDEDEDDVEDTSSDVELDSNNDEEEALKDSVEYQQAKDDLEKARDSLKGPESDLNDAERQLREVTSQLEKDFGPNEEWAQLDDTCLERNEGEYTYKFCFFGSAEQKSTRDHHSTNLGTFSRWDGPGEPGTPSRYTKQVYEYGQKCWNGPERSVHLTFECGEEGEILSVTEPEKCEYNFLVRSPAVCPLEDATESTATEKKVPHVEL